VYKLKGCEKLSEMDKKKLQLKYPNGCMPGSRKDDTARVSKAQTSTATPDMLGA
jgi:hypothetical protein